MKIVHMQGDDVTLDLDFAKGIADNTALSMAADRAGEQLPVFALVPCLSKKRCGPPRVRYLLTGRRVAKLLGAQALHSKQRGCR